VPEQALTLNKAVIYARVSSKEQEREGYSIPAQLKLLRSYALKNDLIVVKTFIDVETAKQAGRTYFAKMLSFLQDHKDVKIILCEKTDRLYRNFRDYVTIDDLDLTVILVKEGSILNKDSTSDEKFIHGIKVLMAKNYIDNLSEETIKGLTVKAERGEFPNQPPLGYVRQDKDTIIDEERAPLIKDVFEKYADGTYTIREITNYASKAGLRSRRGKIVTRSVIYNILRNPFYYGDFIWGGNLYSGIHPPIVTKELWDRVQQVFEEKHRGTSGKRRYAYCGLLRCADCGCAITAETQKQKYIYYHCTLNKGKHNNIYVREEELEAQYTEIFRKLHLSISEVNRFAELFSTKREERVKSLRAEMRRLQQKHKLLEHRIDSAFAARLEQKIDAGEHSRLTKQWQYQQHKIEARLLKIKYLISNYLSSSLTLLREAQGAYTRFLDSDQEARASLITSLMQVSEFKDGKIIPVFKHPLDILYQIIINTEMKTASK
jgi:DNA invertase Pin-like site-specific DNA recombinase